MATKPSASSKPAPRVIPASAPRTYLHETAITIDGCLSVADIDLIDQLAAAPDVAAMADRTLLFVLRQSGVTLFMVRASYEFGGTEGGPLRGVRARPYLG